MPGPGRVTPSPSPCFRHRIDAGKPWFSCFSACTTGAVPDACTTIPRVRCGTMARWPSEDRYDPHAIERKWQAVWEQEGTWEVPNPGQPGFDAHGAQELRAGDAALPLGRAPHGAPQELHDGRRARPLPAAQRHAGAAPDGLRRLRPAGREPRDQDRRAPGPFDRRLDRGVPPPVPLLGHLDRLAARVRHARAALLPLDAVDLPEALRARASPTASRRRSSGARTTRPCSPTSR